MAVFCAVSLRAVSHNSAEGAREMAVVVKPGFGHNLSRLPVTDEASAIIGVSGGGGGGDVYCPHISIRQDSVYGLEQFLEAVHVLKLSSDFAAAAHALDVAEEMCAEVQGGRAFHRILFPAPYLIFLYF